MTKPPKFDPNAETTCAHDTRPLPEGAHTDENIEEMFDTVLAEPMSPSFTETLESLYAWWEEKGFLTARQYEVLETAYTRIAGDDWEPGEQRRRE